MHRISLLFFALIANMVLTGCCSTPETDSKAGQTTKIQTKGQLISKCLDNASLEDCDKRYNP